MKNNKLTLEKFKIAKLNNPNFVIGGYATCTGDNAREVRNCILRSAIRINPV